MKKMVRFLMMMSLISGLSAPVFADTPPAPPAPPAPAVKGNSGAGMKDSLACGAGYNGQGQASENTVGRGQGTGQGTTALPGH
jgi:hypothetical protein